MKQITGMGNQSNAQNNPRILKWATEFERGYTKTSDAARMGGEQPQCGISKGDRDESHTLVGYPGVEAATDDRAA